MVFISRIKCKNFKSFRLADVPMTRGFMCLAGPNGSGKSNICDAIRFALGEGSLKAMRAKKISELIYRGAEKAEIYLTLDGEKKVEIKRALRADASSRWTMFPSSSASIHSLL